MYIVYIKFTFDSQRLSKPSTTIFSIIAPSRRRTLLLYRRLFANVEIWLKIKQYIVNAISTLF